MRYEHVLLERTGDVLTITLDDPDKRNTLTFDAMFEVTAALNEAGASGARGVVLAANGPVFSAGHSLEEMAAADLETMRRLFDVCRTMMGAVQTIPQPVVARVHGLATAGGCQLVATCDLAVAGESASFALPGGKGGLFCHTPSVAVARAIGPKRALEMALTGSTIDAHTAAGWGLVNRVVPDDELDAAVADLIGRASRGSALAKGVGKRGFYAQIDLDQSAAYDYASELMSTEAMTDDAQEAFNSFIEKRRAVYTQRP